MRNRDRNKGKETSEFLRYSGSEMTDRERHAFERELQRDPFAAEAAEGFSEISSSGAASDLSELDTRLKKRISGRRKITFYSAAASIAVLMILSSVFLLIQKNRPPLSAKKDAEITTQFEIAKPGTFREPSVKEEPGITAGKEDAVKSAKKQQQVKIDVITTEISVTARSEMEADLREIAAPERFLQPSLAVKGRILSSEDNLPLPGANVTIKGTTRGVLTDTGGNFNLSIPAQDNLTLVASYIGMETKEFRAKADSGLKIMLEPDVSSLEEVVVVGYGTAINSKEETGYTPPEPTAGRALFNKYIEENLVKPSTMVKGQRAVVVIGFTVDISGQISNLKVIRSPGKEYSDEATRLIRSGPAWKPSVQDGVISESEARVRIVFK
jgi:hypothetical protein